MAAPAIMVTLIWGFLRSITAWVYGGGMVWYGMAGVWRSYIRDCGTPGCELNSCMRCGDLGLAPSQMVSSLFRPSCALYEVDNRFVTQLAQHLGRVRRDPRWGG